MGRDRAPLRRAQRAHLRAGRRDQSQRRAGGALRRRRQPAHRAAQPRASGAPAATPTKRRSAASSTRRCVPTALLAKAHMPDLAKVVPAFNVESIEGHEVVTQRFPRKVEFESIDFNKRFLATVPSEYDPVALRELFSPGFLAWVTTMSGEIDFGVNDRQLWFLWRLRERSEAELKAALKNAGQLFRRLQGGDGRERHPHLPAGPLARRAWSRSRRTAQAG